MKQEIKGLIIQPFYEPCIFKGQLFVESNGVFRGDLNDRWGDSEIEGRMLPDGENLTFVKRYRNRPKDAYNDINYSLRSIGPGMWKGTYDGQRTLNGEAMCETVAEGRKPLLSLNDWERLALKTQVNEQTTERVAKSIIDVLVKEGKIEIRKDPETGEELIILK